VPPVRLPPPKKLVMKKETELNSLQRYLMAQGVLKLQPIKEEDEQ